MAMAFRFFETHHTPRTSSTGRPPGRIHDAREGDLVFAGWSDVAGLKTPIAQFVGKRAIEPVRTHAPELAGIADFHVVVADPEVDRVISTAADHDAVVAGKTHLRREEPAHVRVADG